MQRELEQKAYRKAVVPDYCQTNGRIISVTVDIFVLIRTKLENHMVIDWLLSIVISPLLENINARGFFFLIWNEHLNFVSGMFYSILGRLSFEPASFAAFYNEEKSCRWVFIRGLLLCVQNEK